MNGYQHIRFETHHGVARIQLNRPRVHHAMNLQMIRELRTCVNELSARDELHLLTLSAPGPNFCAGADLEWMRAAASQSESEIRSESLELAGLFQALDKCPQVVIAAVQGRVMGGGLGILAASDLVLAEETCSFAFSEVKLGLVPATIAPYVIRKMGHGKAQALMISGRPFDASEAREGGLVHQICRPGSIESSLEDLLETLKKNGPDAMKTVKELFARIREEGDSGNFGDVGASFIARVRTSEEGQEGMNAFFEKRKPHWHGNP